MLKYSYLFFISWVTVLTISAQPGQLIRFRTTNAMFPDTARALGHSYEGKWYDAANHYSDSSVLIYVPSHFSPSKKINIVYWFHGWGNNIDSACQQFQLLQQFAASNRNAVFVFPEGPKNAPDSYGGKLEQPFVFESLTKEIIAQLSAHNLINQRKSFQLKDVVITLAGHSGAYRVISKIINHIPIQEVILFDAMYGGNESYLQWLTVPKHRFICIYTKEGGTYENSQFIMRQLTDSLKIPFLSIDETLVSDRMLRKHRKLFIYSSVGHNEVITHNQNWARLLRNSF